jgi:multidrug efflux system outer membrane protein
MIRYTSIIYILAILVVGGCKVGPNYEAPILETSASFMYDSLMGDSTLNIAWWELFDDEQLDTLIKTALANNLSVLQAASRVNEAMAYLGFNQANLWPALGYNGNVLVPDNSKVSPGGSFLTAGIVWELDFWGKFRRANEAARAELLASQFAQRWIYVNLITEVASTYFAYLDFKQRYDISVRTLASRQESMRIIAARFEKGIAPELDLNQAQIQEAIAAAAIPQNRRLMAITENTLSLLLGQHPSPLLIDTKLGEVVPPAEIPVGIPSEILARRPDVRQAEQILIAQNARIGVAQAMRFPSISLTGIFGAASPELGSLLSSNSLGWSAAAGIVGPVFEFGKNKRRVEIERFRTEQAMYGYEESILLALTDVDDALISLQTNEQALVAVTRQMKAAMNANLLSKERYDGGVTSYLEVLDSERTLFNAELLASSTYRLQLISYVQLYKSLGGGWITPEERQAEEDAAETSAGN